MNANLITIKKISEEFTSQTFGTDVPHNLCFSTCLPLSILLEIKGIQNTLTCGDLPNIKGFIRHFWLTLDGDGTILDPTIRQFDEKQESVYIGRLADNVVTKNFIPIDCSIREWFKPQHSIWAEPLIDKQPRTIERPNGFEEKMILINIKTATILNNYIEAMPQKDKIINTNKYNYYFLPIFKFLKNKSTADENFINYSQVIMPENFRLLLLNALNTKLE